MRQTIKFTDPQAEVIRREAEKLGISFADLVRRIVDQWRINIAGPPFRAGLPLPGSQPSVEVTYQWVDRPKVPQAKPAREKEPKS